MVAVKPSTLPLIALPYGTVLLPGVVLRIYISDRRDITSLLNKLSNNSSTLDATNVAIGLIPLRPPTEDSTRVIHEEGDEYEKDSSSRGTFSTKSLSQSALNVDPSSATVDELFTHGAVARIVGIEGSSQPDHAVGDASKSGDGLALVVEGVSRFAVKQFRQRTPWIEADVEHFVDEAIAPHDEHTIEQFLQLKALSRELVSLLRSSNGRGGIGLPPLMARRLEILIARKDVHDAGSLADFMVSAAETTFLERLEFLAAVTVPLRLEKAVLILTRQVELIKSAVQRRNSQNSPVPALVVVDRRNGPGARARGRRGISSGMGAEDEDVDEDEIEELVKTLKNAELSPEADRVAKRELQRLKRMSPVQAEYGVCRTYLETLAEIPWTKMTEENLGITTLARARKQLNDDHYGLEKIKKRLLEYLAVLRLKQQLEREREAAEKNTETEGKELVKASDVKAGNAFDSVPADRSKKRIVDKSPILLLVGPPGTGKTSLAKSVATALGRKFHRISLGGVRDEAEIRGHRRTYVAAMPGVIVNALKKVGVANPVILLDEIDKVGGANFHGDPSAAMLEVLDPEQNWSFTDHYINIPIDLSKVLFIATANSLDTIPPPLLDRMETIQLSGYTSVEKKHIASQYLIPKQLKSNGLSQDLVDLPEEAIYKIITSYTRESGVRNLEREVGSVCRAKAVEFSEAKDRNDLASYKPRVEVADLENILGIEKFDHELAERSNQPGVVTGLVAFSVGGTGAILFIETSFMPGNGKLQLTGKLGDVIKESVEVALTWVRAHAYVLGLTHHPDEDLVKNKNVHVHCPAGAVPKDGPSAGMAFTLALISLFSERRVAPTLAMTGEMSLRGKVTAVGGIKEKLIGALTAGVKTVLLPTHNKKDVKELPQEVKDGLEILYVRNIWEALKYVWPEWTIGEQNVGMLESRL
ncbi:Lon protease C-terminal proteolytic domain-containing protein [Sphaerosporella brunnea]|uniref:Lon protease homolog 2, peroxisomal n=1 Tax=Sphaerosporella brunnea TaxID=1250544 RepID=A0A5J5ECT5_9PEZI|nr:Lon protease C-terminal proteolytic domain-containing protein [Sphaerosporella brunnea]